jgi:hypothetical protein
MNEEVVSKHIDSIAKIFDDARSGSFINLPRLVITLHYLSLEQFGAGVNFIEAKNGYTLFYIKEVTFMMVYPPKDMQIRVLCRNREAYQWASEFILGTKSVAELMKFISEIVNNPPSPLPK